MMRFVRYMHWLPRCLLLLLPILSACQPTQQHAEDDTSQSMSVEKLTTLSPTPNASPATNSLGTLAIDDAKSASPTGQIPDDPLTSADPMATQLYQSTSLDIAHRENDAPVLHEPKPQSNPAPEPEALPPIPPTLRCTSSNPSITVNEPVQIDCELTGESGATDEFKFSWWLNHAGSEILLNTSGTSRLIYTPTAVGDYHIRVIAEDEKNQLSAALVITTVPPPLSVDCPVELQLSSGQSADLRCTVTHGVSATVHTEWSLVSAPVSATLPTQTGAFLTWIPPLEGNYLLQFSVDDGYTQITRQLTLTVTPISSGLKILPLGDSITQSNSGHKSYRYALWQRLINASADFDFIGSERDNAGGPANWPDYAGKRFDQDHEGHWGWRTDQILGNLEGWLKTYPAAPDVVLMHLGTNDVFQRQTIESTLEELRLIIARLRQANPSVWILMAKLIPTSRAENTGIAALNSQLDAFAGTQYTSLSPVIIVDQNAGYSTDGDSFDGVHPNALGEEKMAQNWFYALQSAGLI